VVNKAVVESELAKIYRILVENIGEGLVIYDKNMVVTFVNDKMCEIVGYSREEILGREVSTFFEGENKKKLLSELSERRKGKSSCCIIGTGTKEGKEIFLSISSVPLFDEKGRFSGTVAVVSNSTERNRLEEELKRRTIELEEEVTKRSQLLVDLYRGVAATEERNRLAQEIHDSLAQTLATSLLKIEMCHRLLDDNPEKAKRELLELKKMLAKSIKLTRQVIFGLRLPNLHRMGFTTVLKQYFEEFCKKTGIISKLNIKLEKSLPVSTQLGIYRIIREAMNNVRKHAMAKHVYLRLTTDKNGYLYLAIEDDGKGFDLKKVLTPSECARHFGLRGMEEQAKLLGGTFTIQSAKGQGTKIKVKVPLKQ
jgi:PAS domain S-box-containing protein